MTTKNIIIEGKEISIFSKAENDYISLTDMARSQLHDVVIIKWLSLKNTIEYLGEWETLYNPDFNYTEYGTIKNSAGSNNFVLSVKQWIKLTGAIGITAKAGRYGGTYAHKDLAFHFGMWISPKFQLLLVKEYQRLKEQESKQLDWNIKRTLAKVNYRIHTDAIKENLIPKLLSNSQINL
ncbi:MAG: KilA-N domain-containing protein, partial [Proteobacteria bacterium]|nr:KilA-N domain-containing protein [Pseudomonadota bacterium]